MTDFHYGDQLLRDVLLQCRVIAVVGFSAKPERPSHRVASYLQERGHDVVLINPGLAGQVHLGSVVYGSLADVTRSVDMIDIFRRSDAVPQIVDAALSCFPKLNTIWMQLGVEHAQAAQKASAWGVTVVQNRCPKIEYARLYDGL